MDKASMKSTVAKCGEYQQARVAPYTSHKLHKVYTGAAPKL